MWALRSTSPPRPPVLKTARTPEFAQLGGPPNAASAPAPTPSAALPTAAAPLASRQLPQQQHSAAAAPAALPSSAAAQEELSRLIALSDVGSLLAERVALRARVRELEAQSSATATRLEQEVHHSDALAHTLQAEAAERSSLAAALASSQREARSARQAAGALVEDMSSLRTRGEDAERRAWQLQALMASQATAAAGVVTDWVGSADRARAQRFAFYGEQLEEARERAAGAEAALGAAHAAWAERLANETLALRLQAEAAEHSASGRLAVQALQLRGEQERCEELAAQLARCEAALREALRRAAAAEGSAAECAQRCMELEEELARLRALACSMRTEEAVQASLAAVTAQLKEQSELQLARMKEAYEARLAEAQEAAEARGREAAARLQEALARAEALERAAAQQQSQQPQPEPAFAQPMVHASVSNPLLPKGFYGIKQFLEYIRSPQVNMQSSQLVIFVDCTKSNDNAAKNPNKSYPTKDGKFRSLHDVSDPYDPNPYYRVIRVLGKHLEEFDDDKEIPLYGFGDRVTKDKAVFAYSKFEDINRANGAGKAGEAELAALLAGDATSSAGIEGVLKLYCSTQPRVTLQGPTSFAPAIEKTIEIVERTGEFTICLIIADGCIDTKNALEASRAAVLRASKYPISIITVGVGDGEPGKAENERWEQMDKFDDSPELRDREFDNFHFVEHK